MSKNQRINKTPLHYSRNKDKIEIDGDPKDVRKLAWLDLCSARIIRWIVICATILGVYELSIPQVIWKWIRELLS